VRLPRRGGPRAAGRLSGGVPTRLRRRRFGRQRSGRRDVLLARPSKRSPNWSLPASC